MNSLEHLDFSSFIIFPDDPWSLLVSFRQLFKLLLVVQCCNVICEWPLTVAVLHAAVAGTLHHNDNKRFCGQLKCGAAGAMVSVEGPGAN